MKTLIIQGSLFGAIADVNQWSNFSCINENGMLNINKYSEYMRLFANMGANYTREIPFLVTDKHYTGSKIQRNHQPFMFNDGKYSLSELSEQYFLNFKEMIKAAHRHGMGFQWSIFDRCHGLLANSCWTLNHQNIKNWYSWNQYAEDYVIEIIATVKDAEKELRDEGYFNFNIMFELENEPKDEGFCVSGIETYRLLRQSGYRDDQIELGVFYIDNKVEFNSEGSIITTSLFNKFKKAMRNAGLYDGSQKGFQLSTVHDFGNNENKLDEVLEMINHTRRFSFSNDGQKPKTDRIWWYDTMLPIFVKMKSKNKDYNWKFEVLYRGDLEGSSMFNDSMTGLLGLSSVFLEVFGKDLENRDQFSETIYPPIELVEEIIIEEPEPVEPVPEPIIKEENMFNKIWDGIKKWAEKEAWFILSHFAAFILGAILL